MGGEALDVAERGAGELCEGDHRKRIAGPDTGSETHTYRQGAQAPRKGCRQLAAMDGVASGSENGTVGRGGAHQKRNDGQDQGQRSAKGETGFIRHIASPDRDGPTGEGPDGDECAQH